MLHVNKIWETILKFELPSRIEVDISSVYEIDWKESKIHPLFWFELDIIAKQRYGSSVTDYWFNKTTVSEIVDVLKSSLEAKRNCGFSFVTVGEIESYERFIRLVDDKLHEII